MRSGFAKLNRHFRVAAQWWEELIKLEQVGQGYVHNILRIENAVQVVDEAHLRIGSDYFDRYFRLFLADIRAHEVNGVAFGVKGPT